MAGMEKVFDAIRNCVTEPKCKDCPWEDCEKIGCKRTTVPVTLLLDALELLKDQQETIASLQGTICKLNAALEEQPKQRFFVDSDGKITPLPMQKHGRWIDRKFGEWKCSACNNSWYLEVGDPEDNEMNYCPICGAKMDEEVINNASKNS